ncbi:interferon C [Xyrichtys novacula]|uniref:Interferon C n=1 Tax=Xyrichtys novacula TaxID=13765 RepID=A0AAV1GPW3_XYRNO|nr:interferon C [Xyrichtys novacula]
MLSAVLILLQLWSLQVVVVSKPTCQVHGDLIQTAHNLLRGLGEEFPDHCLPYNANITFPRSLISATAASQSQCPKALNALNETLWGAQLKFQNPGVPLGEGGVNWNPNGLEQFQGVCHRLIRQMSCMRNFGGSDVLTAYFSNVEAVLQQPESAACGWMALRRDLMRFLNSTLHKNRTCFIWRSSKRL